MTARAGLSTLLLLAFSGCIETAEATESAVAAPAPTRLSAETGTSRTALFAGGCFWGVEGVFSHVRGVTSAVSGYHGGAGNQARYDKVGRGETGHAEIVRVTYDPRVVRYDQLLRIYFSVIVDPTLRDRQGPDVGSQYRTALVPMNEEQRQTARAYLAQLGAAALWKAPIVTRIEPLRRFYPAEAYHQDFMAANPRHGYILRWDAPKVRALALMYPRLYKASFTLG